MNAVVSLLDADRDARIKAPRDELARDFAVRKVRAMVPYPHVTYQGAERYDLDRLDAILERMARHSYHVAPHRCRLSPRPATTAPRERSAILHLYDATAYQSPSP